MSQTLLGQSAVTFRRARRLPIPGDVLVQVGQTVTADTLIARTEVPGVEIPVKVASKLYFEPMFIEKFMLKRLGELVEVGEPLAMRQTLFGLSKDYVTAPRTGYVERIDKRTGIVTLREPAIPVERQAYLPGQIVEIIPGEGAVVETTGLVIAGAFGVGSERHARLVSVVERPDQPLTPQMIGKELAGAIALGGSTVTAEALKKAAQVGVAAVIVGSIHNSDLTGYLGHELGVPITGQEEIVTTLILTTGFGERPMQPELHALLQQHTGEIVSVNGTTHLRSHIIRPEIVIPA